MPLWQFFLSSFVKFFSLLSSFPTLSSLFPLPAPGFEFLSDSACGLVLGSLVFFDLDSDLEVPLTIFDIFCTVLSVMDSVRDSLGDFTFDLLSGSSFLDTSSLKDPDFVTLIPPDPPTWTEDDIFVSFER